VAQITIRLIEILFKDRPTSHISSIVRKQLNDRTYQDPGKIEDALKILGVDDLWFKVGQRLGVGKEDAKGKVLLYVKRRHQIVHRGDYGQTKKSKNRLTPIRREFADTCIANIEELIKALDEVVEADLS